MTRPHTGVLSSAIHSCTLDWLFASVPVLAECLNLVCPWGRAPKCPGN